MVNNYCFQSLFYFFTFAILSHRRNSRKQIRRLKSFFPAQRKNVRTFKKNRIIINDFEIFNVCKLSIMIKFGSYFQLMSWCLDILFRFMKKARATILLNYIFLRGCTSTQKYVQQFLFRHRILSFKEQAYQLAQIYHVSRRSF